jgi:hypothetical protein
MTPRSTEENFGCVPMVECEGGKNSTCFDVGMTPRSTEENFGCGPMVECEDGQNAFGIITEVQQLD